MLLSDFKRPVTAKLDYNLDKLRAACVLYGKLSGKTESEVIKKQSGKLAWNIYHALRDFMPAKGMVKAERLAALARGEGIKVRQAAIDSVGAKYGAKLETQLTFGKKGLNAWALAVQRELALRESGRGFLSVSTPRPPRFDAEAEVIQRDIQSRYGFTLAEFMLSAPENAERKYAQLRWFDKQGGNYQSPVPGLLEPRQQEAIAQAIETTAVDVMQYVVRKFSENARVTGFQ